MQDNTETNEADARIAALMVDPAALLASVTASLDRSAQVYKDYPPMHATRVIVGDTVANGCYETGVVTRIELQEPTWSKCTTYLFYYTTADGKEAILPSTDHEKDFVHVKPRPASTWHTLSPEDSARIECTARDCDLHATECETAQVGFYYFCDHHAELVKQTGKAYTA